jgi:hypothetical protein
MLFCSKDGSCWQRKGERRFDQIRSGLSVAARSEKDVVITAPSSVPFLPRFQAVVDKTNLSLPGWTNIVQSGKTFWKGTVYSGNGYAEFNTTGAKVLSNTFG